MTAIAAALLRALGPRPQPAAPAAPAAAAAAPAAAAAAPAAAPAQASAPAAAPAARVIGVVLLVAGLILAFVVHGKNAAFQPQAGFVLFAGFYVAAQAIERLLELVLPPGEGTDQAQADRAIIVGGLAFLLGVALSLILGLRFLSAVQVGTPPRWLDVFITGLVISGGTKPLHDLIGLIAKAKSG